LQAQRSLVLFTIQLKDLHSRKAQPRPTSSRNLARPRRDYKEGKFAAAQQQAEHAVLLDPANRTAQFFWRESHTNATSQATTPLRILHSRQVPSLLIREF
jgi:hypothetical protein